MYPSLLQELIEALRHLPGVGQKTAQRYAFALLKEDEIFLDELANMVRNLKKELQPCPICGFIAQEGHCSICDDMKRDTSTIMVVTNDQDVVAMERTGTYRGLYHVLGGSISSSKGIYPDDLNIASLLTRTKDVKEVIVAISPTIDGETTALYLAKLLEHHDVLITRIAHGLPMGADLDYADELTLIHALNDRRKMEGQK